MANVVANFSNGQTIEIANSKVEYKFAWGVKLEGHYFEHGFSKTFEGAAKALEAAAAYKEKTFDKKKKKFVKGPSIKREFQEIIEI